MLIDALVISGSYLCAWALRFVGPFAGSAVRTLSFQQYMLLLIFIVPGYLLLYHAFTLYTPMRMQGRRLVLAKKTQTPARAPQGGGGAFAPYKRFAAGKTLAEAEFTSAEHFKFPRIP